METKRIKACLDEPLSGTSVVVRGWLVNNRGNTKIRFLDLNDGSTIRNLQLVVGAPFDLAAIARWKPGSALEATGTLVVAPNQTTPELRVRQVLNCAPTTEAFPIQRQKINLETLRELPHVRHRTTTLRAVMLIRSTLARELHNFFAQEGFLYMHSPIITSNDGEGAGEAFSVALDNPKDQFFGTKRATLAVTGQLQAESYALGFHKVYTFGPTFRAEKSNTKRHAAEFWMVEPEVAFYQLEDIIHLADRMLRHVIRAVRRAHEPELAFLAARTTQPLLANLDQFLNNALQVIDYAQAVAILQAAPVHFGAGPVTFGMDLATEHERYLTDVHFRAPVALVNYPKEIKAFYMHLNPDQRTVAAFDLLVPGIGELIGGSQREIDIAKLRTRMAFYQIDPAEMQWYLDLRTFGNPGSAGFGLGFERLVMYITGIENIRDAIPYPRTFGSLKM